MSVSTSSRSMRIFETYNSFLFDLIHSELLSLKVFSFLEYLAVTKNILGGTEFCFLALNLKPFMSSPVALCSHEGCMLVLCLCFISPLSTLSKHVLSSQEGHTHFFF